MAYEVRKTDGKIFAVIEDGTANTNLSSIGLIGKRYADYGLIYNYNQLHLLENFSNTTPPTKPIKGQTWFDSTPGVNSLKVYVNPTVGWRPLSFSEDLGNSQINNDVNFNGITTFSNDTEFKRLTTFNEQVNFNDQINFDNINLTGSPTFTGTVTFENNVTFSSNVVFASSFNFTDTATFEDDANFLRDVSIGQDLSVTGEISAGSISSSDNIESTGGELISDGSRFNEITVRPDIFSKKMTLYGKNQRGNDLLTILLLQFNEAQGATTITDNSFGTVSNGGPGPNNSITANGSAAVTQLVGKFGSGSLLLNGSTDYLTIADNSNYDFGTQELTFDVWFKTNSASTEQVIISKGTSATDQWALYVNATNQVAFSWNDNTTSISISGGVVQAGRWHHIALTRRNNTPAAGQSFFMLFLDGDVVATSTNTTTDIDFNSITGDVEVGRRSYGTFEYFDGYLDQVRLVKDSKYFRRFTPRTADIRSETIPFYTNNEGTEWRLVFEENIW